MAAGVLAVAEDHERLALLDRLEHFFKSKPDSFIHNRTFARPGFFDAVLVSVPVDGEILLEFDVVGEGEDCDFIVRVKLVHEADRSILNFCKLKLGAAAGIQQQRNFDRLVRGRKAGDFLAHTVFENLEIVFREIRDSPAHLIRHHHGQRNHIDSYPDGLVTLRNLLLRESRKKEHGNDAGQAEDPGSHRNSPIHYRTILFFIGTRIQESRIRSSGHFFGLLAPILDAANPRRIISEPDY